VLIGLCMLGAAAVIFAMVEILYQVISGASPAINKLGLGFLVDKVWSPSGAVFGAWPFIYGTLITAVTSLVLATLIGVSIGIYLSMLAPKRLATVIGPMVEMLAAIPSVLIGFIGIVLIGPFVHSALEPPLHAVLGWIPLFGPQQPGGSSLFTACLVLTIMVVPIIAALTRDIFLTVPRELTEGAEALGATRWEVIRGVVLPTTTSGVIAACVLGFGRALGETIAVLQVVGSLAATPVNLFKPGDTIASRIAAEFLSPVSPLHESALLYLALILLFFGVMSSLISRRIAAGFQRRMA